MSVFGWHVDSISSANSAIYPYAGSAPQVVNGTQICNFQESISATGDYNEYQINTTKDMLYGRRPIVDAACFRHARSKCERAMAKRRAESVSCRILWTHQLQAVGPAGRQMSCAMRAHIPGE